MLISTQATGAALVPASGFDSVPSDLGTLLAVRKFEETHGAAPARVDGYLTSIRAAFQGGTIDTVINEIETPTFEAGAPGAPRSRERGAFDTRGKTHTHLLDERREASR